MKKDKYWGEKPYFNLWKQRGSKDEAI